MNIHEWAKEAKDFIADISGWGLPFGTLSRIKKLISKYPETDTVRDDEIVILTEHQARAIYSMGMWGSEKEPDQDEFIKRLREAGFITRAAELEGR